jgi:peptidoglycan/LPS O-acetylase OafA/YrhL
MLSSIWSVVFGYAAMAIIVMLGTALAAGALYPGGFSAAKKLETPPPPAYLYANLALSFVAALAGGWVCADRAPSQPMIHVAVLAALLLVMSVFSAKSFRGKQPSWYPKTIAAIGVLGVVGGGLIRVLGAAV